MDNGNIKDYMQLPYVIHVQYIEGEPTVQSYYLGTIEELPGCVAQGQTEEQLLLHIDKAKRNYFAKLLQHMEEIPAPGNMRLRDLNREQPRSSRTRVRLQGWTHDEP